MEEACGGIQSNVMIDEPEELFAKIADSEYAAASESLNILGLRSAGQAEYPSVSRCAADPGPLQRYSAKSRGTVDM